MGSSRLWANVYELYWGIGATLLAGQLGAGPWDAYSMQTTQTQCCRKLYMCTVISAGYFDVLFPPSNSADTSVSMHLPILRLNLTSSSKVAWIRQWIIIHVIRHTLVQTISVIEAQVIIATYTPRTVGITCNMIDVFMVR